MQNGHSLMGERSIFMRMIMIILIFIVLLMQYQLWFAQNSFPEVWQLEKQLKEQKDKNNQLLTRNLALSKEVSNLKNAQSALEERARSDLGMIKEGEVYYQLVPSHGKKR